MALGIVYLIIIAVLVAIPVGTIPQIINQINVFATNIPDYLIAIGDFLSQPITIAGMQIPINELRLEEVYASFSSNLIDILRSVGTQSFSLFGSVASVTLSTVGWILVILFISFYMVKDHRLLLHSVVRLLPEAQQPEIYRLAGEINGLWNAFFRARLVLCVIVGVMTFIVATIIELPNALVLALIAGIGEFVPNVGPILASIPAMLIAAFQHNASWLGAHTGAFGFAMIVLLLYFLIQQVENNYLVPRIIGRELNMHPMVVFIAALAGASVAGILGILIAAPVLASARLVIIYIHRKLNDLPPFPDEAVAADATAMESAEET
jgi:predicted PurR-regulated permease PerM